MCTYNFPSVVVVLFFFFTVLFVWTLEWSDVIVKRNTETHMPTFLEDRVVFFCCLLSFVAVS